MMLVTLLSDVPVSQDPSAGLRMTAIEIDLNVRVRGNETYASFADADGPLAVGEPVQVYESESALVGRGRITEIDPNKNLVYMSVDWSSLRPGDPVRKPNEPPIIAVHRGWAAALGRSAFDSAFHTTVESERGQVRELSTCSDWSR